MHKSATLLLLAALCIGLCCAQEECPDISKCAKDVSELRDQLNAKSLQISKLQEEINKLKGDVSAADTKRAEAESKLSAAQADTTSAQAKLSNLEKELSKTATSLETTQSKLSRAESDLGAAKAAADEAAGAGSSCKVSLQKAKSKISEQASRLDELKAIEEALLPLWLSRRLIQAQVWTAAQLKALKESDLAAQAAAKVAPYWEQVLEVSKPYYEQASAKVAPYWEQAMEVSKPARDAASVYYKHAKEAYDKLPIADTVKAAKQQASVIEGELKQTLKAFIATQPALASLNDPVVLQLLVYTVMGLPLLLLLVVLLALLGGPRQATPSTAPTQGKGKKINGGGAKKEAAARAGKQAVKGGQGQGRKGKAVRSGGDVLYTP